jgi:hypothetical protein
MAPSTGVGGFVANHGGLQGLILLLVFSSNAILSALRNVVKKFEGVEGEEIPADKVALTLLNKAAILTGKVLDYMTANVKH